MLMYLIYTSIMSIFQPRETTLINVNLKGYWMVLEEPTNPTFPIDDTCFRVIKFNRCKKAARQNKKCTYQWDLFDQTFKDNPKELRKQVKKRFSPEGIHFFWVESHKIDNQWHDTLLWESQAPLRFFLKKKNLTIHLPNDTTQIIKLRKIR